MTAESNGYDGDLIDEPQSLRAEFVPPAGCISIRRDLTIERVMPRVSVAELTLEIEALRFELRGERALRQQAEARAAGMALELERLRRMVG